jgi:hypothetical protein
VTIAALAVPTASGQVTLVTNPGNSSQSVAFVKQDVPADIQDHLPSIAAGTLLALALMIGGVATPVLVDSAGTMVVPLGAVPVWLTPALFPSPDSISETDDSPDEETSSSS